MFCSKCGKELSDEAVFCPGCGNSLNAQSVPASQSHDVPKCTRCGHVGKMKPGPLFRKSDILWIALLMFLAGSGFIYLLYILIVRGNPKNREKICPKCKSTNMFTYVY